MTSLSLVTVDRRPPISGPLLATGLTALRELGRAFSRRRGSLLLVVLLLLVALPSGLRIWSDGLVYGSSQLRVPAQQLSVLVKLFGSQAGSQLSAWPSPLVGLSAITILALPLLVLCTGFDAIAGDLERRSLRLFLSRTSLPVLLAGRVIGLWLTVSLMVLIAFATVGLALVAFGKAEIVGSVLSGGARLWLACALSALPYAALTVLFSTVSGPPARALVLGLVLITALALLKAASWLPTGLAPWLLPGANDGALLAFGQGLPAAALRLAVWSSAVFGLSWLALRARSV
jgi:ABC-type transport system involved in multi-copper enzyme maturation permease subunit